MTNVIAALSAAILGLAGTVAGTLAQAGGSSDFGPWAQVGGIATAVGALSYVAKLLADGKLVAQPIAELAKAAEARDNRLAQLVEASHQREDSLRQLLMNQTKRGNQ